MKKLYQINQISKFICYNEYSRLNLELRNLVLIIVTSLIICQKKGFYVAKLNQSQILWQLIIHLSS